MLTLDRLQQVNAVHHFVDRNVDEGRGERVAFRTARQALTYRELLDLVQRAANVLLLADTDYERRVLLVLPDSIEFVALLWGAIRIGAVPVPVHTRLSTDDYAYICADCRPQIAIVAPEHAETLATIRQHLPFPRTVIVAGAERAPEGTLPLEPLLAEAAPACEARPMSRDDMALIQYTSGSTGMPKGVVHLHRGLLELPRAFGARLELREDDLCFSAAKLFFGYGLGNSVLFPQSAGASALLHAPPADPIGVFKTIDGFKPTVFFGSPSLYAAMLAVHGAEEAFDLSSVRLCISAGEALSASIFERWRQRFGMDILDGLGSTECLHIFISGEERRLRPGCTGTVVPPYEVKLLDDQGTPVGPGEVGHVHVSGPANAARYWNRHDATQATMVGRWTRTGDLMGRDADGFYFFVGRTDDVLKVRGMKVSPLEIEECLVGHPAVRECAVVGATSEEGVTTIHAYVRLDAEWQAGAPLKRELREHLQRSLAAHKVPRVFEFVDELPRSGTGKLARYKLRERLGGGPSPVSGD